MNSNPAQTRVTALALFKLLRPLQWIKNLFVFAPILFAVSTWSVRSFGITLAAFLSFSFAASSVYIFNDLNDVERDRRHPSKRFRPIASGLVSPWTARLAIIVLVALSVLVLAATAPAALVAVAAYLLLNVAYTVRLKHLPVVDIFCIAAGFVLRVVAGGLALGVPISSWTFVTTLCLALYLASVKRHQELLRVDPGQETRAVLQFYTVGLVDRYAEMSAVGALLFYSLFVLNDGSRLVPTIPLVIFGLYRYWYIVEAKGEGESPTDALVHDPLLITTIILWAATIVY